MAERAQPEDHRECHPDSHRDSHRDTRSAGAPDTDTDKAGGGASARIRDQHLWVELQVQAAMARGEFDDLPGAGKPIEGLGEQHDPDWWLKKMVEREKVSVLPAALSLRQEDRALDALLDREGTEKQVRDVLEDFNRRIITARRQLEGGPPVITPIRDIDAEVAAWTTRRTAQRTSSQPTPHPEQNDVVRRRWWRR